MQRVLSRAAGAPPAAAWALAATGLVAGAAVALADVNALYLLAAALGCVFILLDFRVGVVALIVLMPLSRSHVFPHAMFGITGLNPVNLLLAGTLGACVLQGLGSGALRGFVPRPLLWLYVAPILVAAAFGVRHVDEIVPGFYEFGLIQFHDAKGYFVVLVFKPLLLVVFALLVAAAAARSAKPEAFLVPICVSIWVMAAMVAVFVLVSGAGLELMARSTEREYLSPLGLHANELGRLYMSAYALLLFTAAEPGEKTVPRPILHASLVLLVICLMLTFSRGAFVGFMIINALFLLWRRSGKVLLLGALLGAAAPLLLPEAVFDRATMGFGEGANAVSAGRIDGLWLPLLPEVLSSPVFGGGLGSILWSDAMYAAGAGDPRIIGAAHPHSAYLETLLDMGVVGLALLGAYFLHVWRGLRARAADAALRPEIRGFCQGAAVGLVALLISYIVDSSLLPKTEQVYLWLAIGLMYGLPRRPA